MNTVAGNPVIFELPLVENGVALIGKASVLNALTNNGFTYCRHKTPAGTYSAITVGDWSEDGTTGVYRCTITASGVEGKYSGLVVYVEAGHTTQTWFGEEEVYPAAADPAALATAIAGVQTILLGSEVTVTSPLATDGTIVLLQGDTYDSDETRAIVFSLTGQPDLTSATATLLLSWGSDSLAVTGAITNAGQATQTITVELTAAQTVALPVTGITYALKATLANTHVVTMQTGRVIVSAALPAN